MRLPNKKKAGDPVLAADWNLLLDAIVERTPRSGVGLRLTSGSSGFAYSAPPPSGDLMRGFPPFSVLGIEKTDSGFNVAIKEGYVIERVAKGDADAPDAVYFHSVTYGGSNLEAIPRPLIPMVLGNTLWCKYQTDAEGIIKATPELIVGGDTQESTHYLPPDPEDNDDTGTEGEYFVKLFKLGDDDGTPLVTAWQQSDIEHHAALWTARYTGEGQGILKGYDKDKGVHVFRRIDGRGYWHEDSHDDGVSAQIQLVKDTSSNAPQETIRVIGNGKVGSLWYTGIGYGSSVKLLEWNDGLVITSGDWVLNQGPEGYIFQEKT